MPAKDAKCNCDFPFLVELSNPIYLGRSTKFRICCLTTFIEQMYEVDLHETVDIEPVYSWNEELAGQPIPQFIADRIAAKRAMGFEMNPPMETEETRKMHAKGGVDNAFTRFVANIQTYMKNVEPNDNGRKKMFKEHAPRARESWLSRFTTDPRTQNGRRDHGG